MGGGGVHAFQRGNRGGTESCLSNECCDYCNLHKWVIAERQYENIPSVSVYSSAHTQQIISGETLVA